MVGASLIENAEWSDVFPGVSSGRTSRPKQMVRAGRCGQKTRTIGRCVRLFRHYSIDGAAVKIRLDPVPDSDAHDLTVVY